MKKRLLRDVQCMKKFLVWLLIVPSLAFHKGDFGQKAVLEFRQTPVEQAFRIIDRKSVV